MARRWARHLVAAVVAPLLTTVAGPASAGPAAAEDRFRDWAKQVDGSHYLAGRVTPEGAGQEVVYQRRMCAACRWKPYATQLTDATGRFQVRIDFPRRAEPVWAYRGFVRATAGQPRAEGRVWLACARVSCRNPGV